MSVATSARTPAGTKFRTLADRLTAEIEQKRRPMSQNPTHKLLREYHSRLYDADQLESGQRGLYALADAHDAGTLPLALVDIKSKAEVLELMRLQADRTGDYLRTNGAYSNTTPLGVALQELVAAATGPQDDAAKEALRVRRRIEDIENDLRFQKIPGFFPTPAKLADQVAALACINPGNLVLEPSAGLGNLADAAKRAQPHCIVHCIEIMHKLAEVLQLKGHAYIGSDFMSDDWYIKHPTAATPRAAVGRYDRIIMNPPFENGQDGEHVIRAFSFLKAGGILVAVISPGPLCRQDTKAQNFRHFVGVHGAQVLPVPSGMFTGAEAFKQTGVETRIVVMRKQS